MLTPRETLIALATKHNGDWQHMFLDIQTRELDNLESYTRDERAITILDSDYPAILKEQCQHAPLVLFYKGDITLLGNKNTVAILGTRTPSGEADMFTDAFIRNTLPSDRVIITGLSLGIGATSTLAALESGHKVIAVLGSGVDYCYPLSNKDLYDRIIAEGGLVISEYPFDTLPQMENFPARNRIIATLAHSVCSMELSARSGHIITLNWALSQGKEIYARPNPSNPNDFNNRLIDEGANCLTLSTTF